MNWAAAKEPNLAADAATFSCYESSITGPIPDRLQESFA